MSETRWKGNWWLPQSPEAIQPGTLHYDDAGDLRLELIGGFDVTVRRPMAASPGINVDAVSIDGSFPVIHGASGGELFTLMDCQAMHTSGGLIGDITDQTITAIRGLRGILVRDGDDQTFDSLELRIEYLLAWSAAGSMSVDIDRNSTLQWTGKQTALSVPVEDRIAAHEDLTITLRVPHTQFDIRTKHSGNARSVTSSEYSEIVVASSKPCSLNEFDGTAKALQDLLTLAAHGPAGILHRSLWHKLSSTDSSPGGPQHEVEVMGSTVYKAGSNAKSDPYSGYLFTLADVNFAELIPAWLTIHAEALLPCSMLFGTQYLPAGYTGTRLFTVASVAEGLHRSLQDSLPLSNRVFKDGLKKVLGAVTGDEYKPFRALIREQVHNSLTYRQRLHELTQLPDPEAISSLLPDVEQWIKLLKNARNGAAHADHSKPGSQLDPVVMFWLTEVSYILLSLVLMAKVGISAEVQRRAVQTQEIMHAIHQYKSATTHVR